MRKWFNQHELFSKGLRGCRRCGKIKSYKEFKTKYGDCNDCQQKRKLAERVIKWRLTKSKIDYRSNYEIVTDDLIEMQFEKINLQNELKKIMTYHL